MSWLREFFMLHQAPPKREPAPKTEPEPYDYQRQNELVKQGNLPGLYEHLQGHPHIRAYDTIFTISLLVAQTLLNQQEQQIIKEQEGGQE